MINCVRGWGPTFVSTCRGVNARLAQCLNSVFNVKAVVGAFNQEKALVGAFSVITNLRMKLFQALDQTHGRGPAPVSSVRCGIITPVDTVTVSDCVTRALDKSN